ncbi:MAG TPA: tripartite tricarboxylate transporter substrate-binding protein [Symbiobacteriaceae bacterium]|nr:tripartite tricarboxylate transporter substrate-binding protein [Symbiobacteriaceae bacterium]
MGVVLTAALLLSAGGGGAKPAATTTETPKTEAAKTEAKKTWAPEKPVTLIVPYSAGGSTEVLARAIEKVWSKYVPQPLTVVNKPGASGWEGRDTVARSKPDGYTIMMGYGSGEDLIAPQIRKATFDPINDFIPLARMSSHSVLIVSYYEETLKKISEDPDFKKGMADTFQPVMYLNSKDFTAVAKQSFDQYTQLIKDLNIKAQ